MRQPHWAWMQKHRPDMTLLRTDEKFGFAALSDIERKAYRYNAARMEAEIKAIEKGKADLGAVVFAPNIIAATSLFAQHGAKVYKIGRDFGESLLETDLKVSGKYLPVNDEMVCIEFPDSIRFELGAVSIAVAGRDGDALKPKRGWAHCAYAMICNGKVRHPDTGEYVQIESAHTQRVFDKWIIVFMPLYDAWGEFDGQLMTFDKLVFGIDDTETVEAALDRCEKFSNPKPNRELVNYVLNCLLYLHSGDPDLRHMRKLGPKPHNAKELQRWLKRRDTTPTVDMIYVGYDWKKPVAYSVDSTKVKAHWRWQPYGPGREKVKRILIAEHTRHFKHHEEAVNE